MTTIFQTRIAPAALWSLAALLMLVVMTGGQSARAQQTPADTVISNTATATYTDGTAGSPTYNAQSLPVTVTVARVAGLAITPDGGTLPNVVAGQNGVDFTFTVTNTSNYDTTVQFLANRASIVLGGSATVAMAVIDANGDGQVDTNSDGVLDAGDIDIKNNAANVSYPVTRAASFLVIVRVNINAAAGAGTNVTVTLGDAPVNGTAGDTSHDNVRPAGNSANEVRTNTTTGAAPVGGEAEARGDSRTTVENDAQLRLSINQPAGPVARGSDITYTWTLNNVGARNATAVTLPISSGAAAAGVGVFVIVPVPQKTVFKNVGVLPAGVTGVLYSTVGGTFNAAGVETDLPDPLTVASQWSTTVPADPTTVRRVAYNLGASLAATTGTVANIQTVVTVQATADTTNPVFEIGDAFAKNNIGATIRDQSGDAVVNKGDGNANFDEPKIYPAPTPPDPVSATQGYQVPTTLLQVGVVYIGPSGAPRAVNTTNNDDFTNLSTSTGINVAAGGNTNAIGTVIFTNTVENAGNANDTFTLTAPTVPTGFTVEISKDGGTTWTTVSGGGSTTLAIAFGATANIQVRITVPAGNTVLTGFSTTIRAASGITPAATNDTIDRTYTGFLLLTKSVRILDAPNGNVLTDAIPGSYLEYSVVYKNIASAAVAGNPNLTANNVVITENGNLGSPAGNTNNWASFTDYVTGTAVDPGGTIDVTQAASAILKDTIVQVLPQAQGTFKFTVKIR
ncbi:MAG TPA: hypothetical protein VF525_09700 [Pyrinomonadaceae bacterium]